ncbi:hypothetical protein Syncc8109_0844 [Synechococcus sp. WH 8109]|nr:hypothetical protein Syncc8109_0844 [Synechococcus sp. WH 8109]
MPQKWDPLKMGLLTTQPIRGQVQDPLGKQRDQLRNLMQK